MKEKTSQITKLANLFAEAWEYKLEQFPTYATFCGEHRFNDRLPCATLESYESRLQAERGFLQRLYAIERAPLSEDDRVNYDLFEILTRDQIKEYEFKSHLTPLCKVFGFHTSFAQMPTFTPFRSVEDYEAYIERLRRFPEHVEQNISLMNCGIHEDLTMPRVTVDGCQDSIRAQMVEDPSRSVFYRPFDSFPDRIPPEQRDRLQRQAQEAVRSAIVPAYAALLEFVEKTYIPAAREEVGLSAIRRGREHYRHLVRHYTTLDLSPEEVHATGLEEVSRIRLEMHAAFEALSFHGDFRQFVASLRKDPRFYVQTPKDLLKEASYILKKMDGELPRLFRTLPRTPYGVKPIPEYMAEQMPCAYYMPPSGDGSRPGVYYVNTSSLDSRPIYELESLSLHEAVPGHHLQLSLQQELKGIPAFRRFAMFTAFIEGWALYAERLGLLAGFYEDRYSNLARLTYEMWRACRLVVDTGLHAFGWTRQRALEYMLENTALTEVNVEIEIDRYIACPGQALAYKIGEIKILSLKREAEAALGEKFDLRDFHDVLLGRGALPLPLIERQIRDYVQSKTGKAGEGGAS